MQTCIVRALLAKPYLTRGWRLRFVIWFPPLEGQGLGLEAAPPPTPPQPASTFLASFQHLPLVWTTLGGHSRCQYSYSQYNQYSIEANSASHCEKPPGQVGEEGGGPWQRPWEGRVHLSPRRDHCLDHTKCSPIAWWAQRVYNSGPSTVVLYGHSEGFPDMDHTGGLACLSAAGELQFRQL